MTAFQYILLFGAILAILALFFFSLGEAIFIGMICILATGAGYAGFLISSISEIPVIVQIVVPIGIFCLCKIFFDRGKGDPFVEIIAFAIAFLTFFIVIGVIIGNILLYLAKDYAP